MDREVVNSDVCYDKRGYSQYLEDKPLCGYFKGVGETCGKGKLVQRYGNTNCPYAHSNQCDRSK